MRHTLVIEVNSNATSAEIERAITQHVNNISAYRSGMRAEVVEYHHEQMTEPPSEGE